MIITDTLNGHTVEDVRRNQDGSVSFFTDNGRVLTLHVQDGEIQARPQKLILPDSKPIEEMPSERMRLREAFVGFTINYAVYDELGNINIVCDPLHGREMYSKAVGHREVRITHHNGLIDELPPVSAVINLEGQTLFGEFATG